MARRVKAPIPFDPARVRYRYQYRNYISHGRTYLSGPIWSAYTYESGPQKQWHIGKTIPPECLPYISKELLEQSKEPLQYINTPLMRGASDTILEALDKGSQVVIDIMEIAKDCGAEYHSLGETRFLIYRDTPIEAPR